jgi:hypothetical protein
LNEVEREPSISLGLAKVYLNATDPQLATRTWQDVTRPEHFDRVDKATERRQSPFWHISGIVVGHDGDLINAANWRFSSRDSFL